MHLVFKATLGQEFVKFGLSSFKAMRNGTTRSGLLTLVASATSLSLTGTDTATDTATLKEIEMSEREMNIREKRNETRCIASYEL
jgi:hypothetical protein